MEKLQSTTVWVNRKKYAEFKRICAKKGIKLSFAIEKLIDDFLEYYKGKAK